MEYIGSGTAICKRAGHYTLVMKGSYTIKDWILPEQRCLTVCVHAGVSAAEMYVPLIVAEA